MDSGYYSYDDFVHLNSNAFKQLSTEHNHTMHKHNKELTAKNQMKKMCSKCTINTVTNNQMNLIISIIYKKG